MIASPELSEARFTVARDDCPHPEHWHSNDDESSELEVSLLVGAFVRALQPALVVETGTAFGQTAEQIGLALEQNGHGRLYTLEPDPERARQARDRVAGLPVDVVELQSLSFMPPALVDFAWIDSLLPLRVIELRWFRPFLPSGAIVGIHDAGPQHGIRTTIEAETWLRPIYLRTPRGVIFAEVR